ncbi:MAG: hypothetical protein OXN84_05760 [Albidovulum sp.]|nr:hypothetical protein [Albidovulum sp.]
MEESSNSIGIRDTLLFIRNNRAGAEVSEQVTAATRAGHFKQFRIEFGTTRTELAEKGALFHSAQSKIESGPYVTQTLVDELVNRRAIPLVAEIKASSIESVGPIFAYLGEDVLEVLIGDIEFHTEGFAYEQLQIGDCAYFGSAMRHACISLSEADARLLGIEAGDGAYRSRTPGQRLSVRPKTGATEASAMRR